MARGPVDKKRLAIEANYGYLNIHLALLHKAIVDGDKKEIVKEKAKVREIKNVLSKLGYFN